jgi:ribonuclease HI
VPKSQPITAYTDGGAKPNPGPGGWGVVILDPEGREPRELFGGEGHTTNNRMELTAAIRALEAVPEGSKVRIYTDSRYLRNGITRWIRDWIARGWKRETGTLKNVDLWKRLGGLIDRHQVEWHWLRGHAGNRHNARADALATRGRKQHGKPARRAAQARVADSLPVEAKLLIKVSRTPRGGGWAVLLRRDGDEEVLTGRGDGSANELLLVAAAEALERLPSGAAVAFLDAPDYLAHGAREWLAKWRRRGWKTQSGGTVKNRRAWERLDAALRRHRVVWHPGPADPGTVERLEKAARDQAEAPPSSPA